MTPSFKLQNLDEGQCYVWLSFKLPRGKLYLINKVLTQGNPLLIDITGNQLSKLTTAQFEALGLNTDEAEEIVLNVKEACSNGILLTSAIGMQINQINEAHFKNDFTTPPMNFKKSHTPRSSSPSASTTRSSSPSSSTTETCSTSSSEDSSSEDMQLIPEAALEGFFEMATSHDRNFGIPERYRRAGLVLVKGLVTVKCHLCSVYIACQPRNGRKSFNFEPYFTSHEKSAKHLKKLMASMEKRDASAISETFRAILMKSPRNRRNTPESRGSSNKKKKKKDVDIQGIITAGVFKEKQDDHGIVIGVTCDLCDKHFYL